MSTTKISPKSREPRERMLHGPGARAALASSVLARLPLAMFSLALLVHAHRLTGSFAVAGAVSGAYALCSALAAPQLGRLVDHRGQTRVLIASAALTALTLILVGTLPPTTAPGLLVALAGMAGAATPPLAACVRTLLPSIVSDARRLPALFAFESTALELTFIAGPPLALGLGELWSTGAALAISGLIMLGGTLLFALQRPSRHWRPDRGTVRPRGGALRSPTLRTLIFILLGTGSAFGATQVGVTSTTHALGSTAMAGPLLGLWGLGSLLAGILTTRLGGGARSTHGLTWLLATLAIAHGALILTTGNLLASAITILIAGATIAPTVSSIYAMVEGAAPAGTQTEAYSWILTASLSGEALGAAAGGLLAQAGGPAAVFTFVGAAGAIATLTAAMRSRTLTVPDIRPDADLPAQPASDEATTRVRFAPRLRTTHGRRSRSGRVLAVSSRSTIHHHSEK